MKLFQFAVASIVDANTGNGLVHTGGRIDYAAAEHRGRTIRAKTVAAVLSLIKGQISNAISTYKVRARQRRGLSQLSRLDNRLLKDIGLTRGDLIAVELGHATLEDLAPQHRAGNVVEALNLIVPNQMNEQDLDIDAVNETYYVEQKCA
jgi:uncharacterized protein YjiS (DUF1127 family)